MEYGDYTPEDYQQMSYDMYGIYQPDNALMADMLRSYVPPNAQEPEFIGLDQKERLEKLLEQGKMTQQQPYQRGGGQMQMPMNMDVGMLGGMGQSGSLGTGNLFGGPAGQATGQMGTYGAKVDAAGVPGGQAGSLNWGGVEGTASGKPGAYVSQGNTNWFGNGGQLGGGWFPAAAGALSGYAQGSQNYRDDPNMWSGKDGYGKYHKDYRAEVGGGVLGGVMGYFGGPFGAALAGPAVKEAHKVMEPSTRSVINFGDKWGGATGAMMMDPVGAASSGKYSWGEIFQVPFTKNLFGW